MLVRLDKLLCANGMGSRKEIRRLLRKHQYSLNGKRVTDPATLLDPLCDTLSQNGSVLTLRTNCYLMLNKPAGVVTSTNDPVHTTVMELLPEPFCTMKLFPIGRLDIDTEGLLLITNDGALTHRITAPKSHLVKTYYLEVEAAFSSPLLKDWQAACKNGLTLKNGMVCLPAQLESTQSLEVQTPFALLLHIYEGKYHQVKKMMHALGTEVVYLKRIAIGAVYLDPNLASGACRELTAAEIEGLTSAANRAPPR